jgi:Ca2+-binding EF-hand superfamily protein
MPGDQMGLGDDYNVFGGPFKKPNNYMKETEKFDQIVYFFDFIDDVFQADMVKELTALLTAAKNVAEEDLKKFDEPYTPEKLLFYFSKGKEGRDPWKGTAAAVQAVEPEAIKRYQADFDVNVWKQSFSAAKISNIIKTFGWGPIPPVPYYFKRLVDTYDFNGNGRLDAREFLFYAIWAHYKTFAGCKQFCFKKIIEEKIDPLFSFLDCDNDGYINSENIWNGLKFLKRSPEGKEKHDFYKCELPKSFNKFYRTHAPNDFILKNFRAADGYLNREEFRKGILLGYWERQVNGLSVATDDSINRKADRWDASGKMDLDCNELLRMFQLRN